jgi:protein-S-isoprenylcysteine O-methyltransferase Ste14
MPERPNYTSLVCGCHKFAKQTFNGYGDMNYTKAPGATALRQGRSETAMPANETPRRTHPLDNRIPPPVLFLAIVLAMGFGAGQMQPLPVEPIWRYALSAGFLALAGFFGPPAIVRFRRVGTTVDPVRIERASQLVVDGIFRRSRNPMYVALVALLAAYAAFLAVPVAALGPVAFVVWIGRFQIAPEERALQARFGAAFEAYCARVRRWL